MLRIEDLAVGFRRYRGLLGRAEVTRLAGVSLAVGRGEVVAVVGCSGAGKSLLAHAILGLLPANAVLRGKITFDGQVVDEAGLRALRGRRIALLPQQVGHLDPLARAGAQIAWAARRVQAAPRVAGRLAEVGLPAGTAALYPHQLSGGMARRVMLAAAHVGSPDLVIADEPTAGLDPEHRDALLARLRRHADGGGGVLLVTHDLIAALPRADRVVILRGGRMCGVERARDFTGAGAGLGSAAARALWRALPQNGFHADA